MFTTPRGPEAAAVASRRGRMAVLQVDHATTDRRVRREYHAQATGRLQLALRSLQEHVPACRAELSAQKKIQRNANLT